MSFIIALILVIISAIYIFLFIIVFPQGFSDSNERGKHLHYKIKQKYDTDYSKYRYRVCRKHILSPFYIEIRGCDYTDLSDAVDKMVKLKRKDAEYKNHKTRWVSDNEIRVERL